MSADPKPLATLAVATAKTKPKPNNNGVTNTSGISSGSSPDDGGNGRRGQGDQTKSFRPTDEFFAGLTAAVINTSTLFPLNKLIFRQMAGGHGTQMAAGQMKEEGEYKYRLIAKNM